MDFIKIHKIKINKIKIKIHNFKPPCNSITNEDMENMSLVILW